MFSYHSANLSHVLSHYSANHISPQEEILLKILTNCYKCLALCRQTNSFFPGFDLEYVLVNHERSGKKYPIHHREPRTWRLEQRETVVMHPLMFRGFLKELSQMEQRSAPESA